MIDLKKVFQNIGFAFAMVATGTVAEASNIEDLAEYHFNVYLDGKEIGTHKVKLSDMDGKQRVRIDAEFDVKMFFISVYRYSHTNEEIWQGQCLDRVESATDANGEKFFIRSSPAGNSMRLVTHDGSRGVEGCVRSFAYWDLELLESDKLLNTQTGEYVSAELDHIGFEDLTVGDITTTAKRYQLITDDGIIDLWYTLQGRWIALESKTESGMTIRYEASTEGNYATASL